MNRRQAARGLIEDDRRAAEGKHVVSLKEGQEVSILVAGKKLGMAYASNGYLVMVPWGKYKIGEYSDETFHPGTAVDSLEVEPSHGKV